MKILCEKYPKGSWNGQNSDGRYIDDNLYGNLKLMAQKIVKDMTFLGIGFSSTLEVGTGKSVLFTQIGEAWSFIMKEVHNIDVPFTMDNVVFRPEDLIDRAFQVPQYSCILLDEWEDAHYWSSLGMTLRKFFRKCRQLNLFILVIIPSLFEMPRGYAISRSIFAIDVKFDGEFNRGNYDFYNFSAKKKLYIWGKKNHDYNVVQPSFQGRFFNGYGVPEDDYRKVKREDMEKYDREEKETKTTMADRYAENLEKIRVGLGLTQKDFANILGCSQQAVSRQLNRVKQAPVVEQSTTNNQYSKILTPIITQDDSEATNV